MKLDMLKKKNKHKYNNYSGLPFETQLLEAIKYGQNQSSKVKNENESMPSEIGFPTLTSDVFLNQKPNKQTSHE